MWFDLAEENFAVHSIMVGGKEWPRRVENIEQESRLSFVRDCSLLTHGPGVNAFYLIYRRLERFMGLHLADRFQLEHQSDLQQGQAASWRIEPTDL
jgi:hypothetical protein